jgi:dolichyl-phosphate beta-glucosyltransferase
MAEAWSNVCRQCIATVSDVPPSILFAAAVATGLGLFVLVSLAALPPPPG